MLTQTLRCTYCKKHGRQDPGSNAYDEDTKAVILAAYHERPSLRGLTRGAAEVGLG